MADTETKYNNGSQAPRRFIKRPDDKVVKQEVEKLRGEIKKLDLTLNEYGSQIDKLQLDPKVVAKRNELQTKLKSIIAKQSTLKTERNNINDQIKGVEQQMKKKIAEIQQQTSKHSFKNVGEIDQRINQLDKLVDQGDLKLADERRYVKEMSSLRKLRKDFEGVEKIQALIDSDKAKIAELKNKYSGLHNKQIQEEFESIQKELDQINAGNKSILDRRNDVYAKRNAIKKQKDEKYGEIRKLNNDFQAQFTKFKQALAEEQKKRDEEYKSRQAEEKKQKLKEAAEKQLAEASIPAFSTEIASIENLLKYFDPSYVKAAPKTSDSSKSVDSAKNIRTVEMPSDVVIIKKDQEEYFSGSKGKKSAKGKKTKAKAFTVDPEIIISLSDLSIPFPTKEEDVPETIKILKETLVALEEKQDEQTKINVEKAKARIQKLEEAAKAEEAEEEEAEESKAE